jgi:hypothetical protein
MLFDVSNAITMAASAARLSVRINAGRSIAKIKMADAIRRSPISQRRRLWSAIGGVTQSVIAIVITTKTTANKSDP